MVILIILSMIIFSCSQKFDQDMIRVTTSSKVALDLYNDAFRFMEDVYLDKANDALDNALKEDTDLFMAYYVKATNSLYFGDKKAFKRYSDQALGSKKRSVMVKS